MAKNRYYYYDHETCSFVEAEPGRKRLYIQGGAVLVVALLLAGLATWGFGGLVETPQELALKSENEALQQQLTQVQQRMEEFSTEIEQLSEADQDLYRTLLEAEPISEDVRRVGVGGADAYEKFSGYSEGTASLLRETSQMLDRLERQISLQNSSYRELTRLAEERGERMTQMPALIPANGPIVSGFGMRFHPILRVRKMHYGIDVLVDRGTPVIVAGDGIVREAGFNAGYGNHVEVEHPETGYTTLYAHLSEIPRHIRPGRSVERGEQIGLSGNTGRSQGPHLHYEVRNADDRPINPVYFFAPNMTPQHYKKLLRETEQMTISLD